jgi:hypothetical protein
MQYCVDPLARMRAALKNNPTSLKFHAKYKYEMVSPSYFQINEIIFLQKKILRSTTKEETISSQV